MAFGAPIVEQSAWRYTVAFRSATLSVSNVLVVDHDPTMNTEQETRDFVQAFVDLINGSPDFVLTNAQSLYGANGTVTPT